MITLDSLARRVGLLEGGISRLQATVRDILGGWLPAAQWTYASSTTVTEVGDVRSRYPVGTKVKYVQGGVQKYGYVTATAYAAPKTTLTLAAGSDYSVANAAITGNYYSYAALAPGFPPYFSYTPAAVGLTTPVYNSAVGRFFFDGAWISAYGRLDIQSWASQSGYMRGTLPTNGASIYMSGSGSYYRQGTSADDGGVTAVLAGGYVRAINNDASDGIFWLGSTWVLFEYSIRYIP